jgi:hypothetical protein
MISQPGTKQRRRALQSSTMRVSAIDARAALVSLVWQLGHDEFARSLREQQTH